MDNPIEGLTQLLDTHSIWEGEVIVKRNELLVDYGSRNSNLYLVKSGALRAMVRIGDQDQTIRFGYEGSLFGSLDAFITGEASKMCIQALKKSELKYVTRAKLHSLFNSSLDLLRYWSHLQSLMILQHVEREIDLLTPSPEERYQRVLSRSPQVFQYIPYKYIADYLRMTPETLSRIRKS